MSETPGKPSGNDPDSHARAQRILGYLNFSSGSEDPSMLGDLNQIFADLDTGPKPDVFVHERVFEYLWQELETGSSTNKALSDPRQARKVLQLTFQHVLPEYLRHHRDLLFHRSGETLFNAFFVGRVFEVVLQLSVFHDDPDDLASRAVGKLNDYIGHRPVAVLETQKLEPYEHEWVRPIPLYIRNAGVVHSQHQAVIQHAINLLYETSPHLLELAQFQPDLLDELAVDPRSFDFDHPINKRPNHHFGQWDEHHIDNNGHYRRFVIHQVTLDALTSRASDVEEIDRDQLIYEAGAVLAGTILMAAGICGYGPGAHDSTVTLANLLPVIAGYRDQFYSDLLHRLPDQHRERLTQEAIVRQQPFGAARQHLNRQLARFRAFQMVHVNLALIFSRMGYESAAIRHANILPVASARMICQIECLLYSGAQRLQQNELAAASEILPRIFDLLQRAVECGAVIDPWNILGFDANYSLFHGTENTVRDHRADDLAHLMEQIFGFASRVWISAQAADQQQVSENVSRNFKEVIDWWHKFAVHEVSSIDSVDPLEIFSATRNVAGLINQWQKSGAQPGDGQFWANHAESFMSARAYILAINSLIDRNDFVTSMVLLIHWLTQSESIPLQQSSGSFQLLVSDWIARQRLQLNDSRDPQAYTETWQRIRKFCDFVEANAGEFWKVPGFGPWTNGAVGNHDEQNELLGDGQIADDGEDLYRAAYEDMVYRESTNDGIDGSIYDPSIHSDESIEAELHRIIDRLEFLQALAEYWVESALFVNQTVNKGIFADDDELVGKQRLTIDDWARQSSHNCKDIERLIRSIQGYALPEPDGSTQSLAEYDRQRLFKETLLDQSINLLVDTSCAGYLLESLSRRLNQIVDGSFEHTSPNPDGEGDKNSPDENAAERENWIVLLTRVLTSDPANVRKPFSDLLSLLATKPLLYVPLSKGGPPLQIVSTRVRQSLISLLLENLPRLGMLTETRELLHVALMMERKQSVRQGAVTEFDELFRVGFTAMVESVIRSWRKSQADESAPAAKERPDDGKSTSERSLVDYVKLLADSMLMLWLSHSQTLRLSVLEKVRESRDNQEWERMVEFIDQFGDGIFTQQFLSLSNIRAILHQGVDQWLESVEEQESDPFGWQVIGKIQQGYPRGDAVRNLTWVLEAIIENFNEYRDYNCTTTQSDNGRLLYIFLDFLRLRCRYDQVCWNLKPVIWAHESLVRLQESQCAGRWRRLVTGEFRNEANRLLERLSELQRKYSIQMATISQRINERFVHPMQVDRLTSLVGPANGRPRFRGQPNRFRND